MRKNNIKVQIEKYSALGLSLALAVSGLAGCGAAQAAQLSQTETAAEESQETETPEEEEWLSKQDFHNGADQAYTG